MKPLNEEQTHFLKTKLIPFAQNSGRDIDFVRFLKTSLNQGRYKEQTLELENRLIPFAESVGERIDFGLSLEIILKRRYYDDVDKIIIEFLIEELKKSEK